MAPLEILEIYRGIFISLRKTFSLTDEVQMASPWSARLLMCVQTEVRACLHIKSIC